MEQSGTSKILPQQLKRSLSFQIIEGMQKRVTFCLMNWAAVILNPLNQGLWAIFFYALRKSSKRFTWSLHDDDWVFDLGGAFPKRLPSDCVGISPILLLTSPAHGVYGFRNFDLCQSEPIDRIKAYASQSAGANSLLFAIWETDLLQNLYQALETHPCHAGYQDWTFVKACLAEGKIISSDRFGYKYNNNNWYGPPASNLEELEDLMRRADLPVELAQKLGLLNIIDLICLFGRNRG
jgi:hypothetical protein